MKSAIRNRIENTRPPETRSKPTTLYLADAATQTNPEGRPEGRQRSAMNAFQHGLSGHRMILQDHELESYRRLSTALYRDYSPEMKRLNTAIAQARGPTREEYEASILAEHNSMQIRSRDE